MDKSWMHADRRSKAYKLVGIIRDHLYFNGIDQSYKIWTWHREPWEWTTNASRNVEEDEQCEFSFVSKEVGMDDNDLGDVGFDPYEFANVIGDGDQPLYPSSSKYTMLSALVKIIDTSRRFASIRKYTTFLYVRGQKDIVCFRDEL
ncbi:unnamed protein product [Prunus armeniaca]